ncbi:MAG: SurA N-terminal domain-containing protein [Thermotogota bacterium]|nr:SurA N-terminal domain-containing protein [Thermotogota bacterium]
MKKSVLLLIIALLTTGIIFGTEGLSLETPVATVNGDPITTREFYAEVMPVYVQVSQKTEEIDPLLSELLTNTAEGEALLKAYEKRVIDKMVREKLIVQYAVHKGLFNKEDFDKWCKEINDYINNSLDENDLTREEADSYYTLKKGYIGGLETYETYLTNSVIFNRVFETLVSIVTEDATVTDKEKQEYYNSNKYQFAKSEENIVATMEIFDTFSKAYSFLTRAQDSTNPLELFTREKSELTRNDLSSLEDKTIRELFNNFEEGLFERVVNINGIFTVLYLHEHNAGGYNSFEEVRDEIEKQLLEEKQQIYWENWSEKEFVPFRENAEIQVSDEFSD